ncbi:MAG: methionyl-tRNA formyltransferase [Bacteroidales bacterium]|nr:methionyl-tRNA formyltransferase [Bacteroidales bacterium]
MGTSPKIVYMGTPEFAVAPLQKLVENGYNIVGVVTVPDKPSGRGLKLNQSAVKQYAMEHLVPGGTKLMQPVSLKDEEFLQELRSLGADMFIVVAFRMLPEVVWGMPPLGTFNLHGSLLPLYRGAAPINWAIIKGEEKSGVTTFLIDKEIDTGNILMQRECPIEEKETIGTLYDKLMEIGAGLVIETVQGLVDGKLTPKPQEGRITGAPKLTRELGRIKWDMEDNDQPGVCKAILIDRLVRGLSPYPAATAAMTDGNKTHEMKVFGCSVVKEAAQQGDGTRTGEIISDGKTYIHVVCADGSVLALEEIQLSGKKRMSVKDFLLGFRNITTFRFI